MVLPALRLAVCDTHLAFPFDLKGVLTIRTPGSAVISRSAVSGAYHEICLGVCASAAAH
jgi:hypothetical protein